ncbi:putative MFS monocarboxylate transporter [Podospora didyma]|uniref:MFS monocarboxylate transporter n=1 Tax=Podospora didyma TaxID=330526 RepID=A0AAE0NZS0_9PEZI|nr:putative MFS monocarboxylate transporter [Podospora didyma]
MNEKETGKGPGRGSSLRAYLTVLGGSLSLFCSVGFLNGFGVFQQYYKAGMLQNMSESDISWIGSISIFLLNGVAPVTGILVDRLGPTWLLGIGSITMLVSVFMTSLGTQYYQFFLSQGVLLGIGTSLITWPPLAVVSRSLPQHRGLALGIVVSGSSLGGVVWPIMLERLLGHDNLGFGWVMRIVGFTMLPLLVIACVTVREPLTAPAPPKPAPQPNSSMSDSDLSGSMETESAADAPPVGRPKVQRSDMWALLKTPTFIFLTIGLAFTSIGLFIPLFYMSSYAFEHGVSAELSFYLISILNAASLFGRIITGHLADRYGHFNMIILSALVSTITAFSWTAAKNLEGMIAISLVYGYSSGSILALQNACVGKIAGSHMQGTAMGMMIGCVAVTSLIGAPVGGALVGKYGYLSISMFTGATLLAGSILLSVSRLKLNKDPRAAY